MTMSGDEKYVEIEATLLRVTAKAIHLKTDLADAWVARSCCHFMTDKAVDGMAPGDEGLFRIMQWVAEREGFA